MNMTEAPPANEVTTYFAVPGHYTIGESFETFDEAVQHAQGTIETFDYRSVGGGFSDSRAFVDRREKSDTGDRIVKRWEVFRDGVVRSRGEVN